MHVGLVGLGKMGNNMRERMRRAGLTVVGYDRNPEVTDTASLAELVQKLDGPRVVWVMLPIQVVDQVIDELKVCSPRATWLSTAATANGPTTPVTPNRWLRRAFTSSTAAFRAASGASRTATR